VAVAITVAIPLAIAVAVARGSHSNSGSNSSSGSGSGNSGNSTLPKPLLAPLGHIERVARRDAQLALTLQLLDKGRDIAPSEGDVLDGGAWVIEWQWLGGSGTVG
jgi:hypothetical protein